MKVYLIAHTVVDTFQLGDFLEAEKPGRKALLDLKSNPETLVEVAGRTCYNSWLSGRGTKEHIDNLLDKLHGSCLEHVSYTFMVVGVSRYLTQELTRHRAGCGFSMRSTRYVDESNNLPDLEPLLSQLDDGELKAQILGHSKMASHLYQKTYDKLVAKGMPNKEARGLARYVLLGSQPTEILVTMNARALRNFFEQRGALAADQEIRELACLMLEAVTNVSPLLFGDYEVLGKGTRKHIIYPAGRRKV